VDKSPALLRFPERQAEEKATAVNPFWDRLNPVWDHAIKQASVSAIDRVMRLLSSNTLLEFGESHAVALGPLKDLVATLRRAAWKNMDELRRTRPDARPISGERVIFKVKGDEYRVIVAIDFTRQIAFVKFVGTHAAYDRIDAHTVNLF
jgi:mRNA interferase HigB